MRIKRNNPLHLLTALAAQLIVWLAPACSNRPEGVLGMGEMTELLTELHTLDGMFETDRYHRLTQEERNLYYEAVLAQHAIGQAQFDSSLVWYSRDPKKFEKIYLRVIDRLTAEEAAVKAGKYHPIDTTRVKASPASVNLWRDSTRLTWSGDPVSPSALTVTLTDTALLPGDRYELHFRRRVGRRDSCTAGQHLYFNLHYAGGAVDSIALPSYADGKTRRYTLRLTARRPDRIDSLRVCFLATTTADSCHTDTLHVCVDDLSLIRRYDADTQEALRLRTRQREAFRAFTYRLVPMPGEKTDFIFRKVQVNRLPTGRQD